MQVKTGLRAGITPQELVQNFQNSATAVVDTVGGASRTLSASVQDAASAAREWLTDNNAGDTLNRLFWFPLDPPQ